MSNDAAQLTNSLLDRAYATAHAANDCDNALAYAAEIQNRIAQGVFTLADFPLYTTVKDSPMNCSALQNPVVIYGLIALVLILLWGVNE